MGIGIRYNVGSLPAYREGVYSLPGSIVTLQSYKDASKTWTCLDPELEAAQKLENPPATKAVPSFVADQLSQSALDVLVKRIADLEAALAAAAPVDTDSDSSGGKKSKSKS